MADSVKRLNFHVITGPNGMCMCGVKADGTVVTCSGLLDEHIAAILASPLHAGAEPEEELQRLVKILRGIVEGFDAEALNGVICTPPCSEYGGFGWADKPHRTWCSRCRARWATLRGLPDLFTAALSSSRTAPEGPKLP